MVDLPTEIWLLIAQAFYDDLSKLQPVNSLFLNCWMDHKWKKVYIYFWNRREAAYLLRRIVDPFVARRVRMLSIDPNPIDEMSLYGSPSRESLQTVQNALLHALTIVPSVTSLDVVLHKNYIFLISVIQTITSSTIARSLQTLFFSGAIGTFPMVTPWLAQYSAHNTPFENLTELTLNHMDPMWDTPSNVPVFSSIQANSSLAPFIRALAPTLQVLRIFGTKPLPGNLFICDALSKVSQSDNPVTFPSLKCLQLQLTDEQLGPWLIELDHNNAQFPSLQILDIRWGPTSPASISALLTLIKCSIPALSVLAITKCYLTDLQAKQVVDGLTETRSLKGLTLAIAHLSVSFLDFLAHKLPNLESLFLHVVKIVGTNQGSFEELLSERRYDSILSSGTQDILHTWRLRHLRIADFDGGHEDLFMDAKYAVVSAVPSVIH